MSGLDFSGDKEMAKKTGGSLMDDVATIQERSAKNGVSSLTDEQLSDLNETLDAFPRISARTIAEAATKRFGVHISRSSMTEYIRKRRTARAAN